MSGMAARSTGRRSPSAVATSGTGPGGGYRGGATNECVTDTADREGAQLVHGEQITYDRHEKRLTNCRFLCASLQAQIAERRMIVRPPSQGPMIFAVALTERSIVNAGNAATHQPVGVELP